MLKTLLGEFDSDVFLRDHWPDRPAVLRGAAERFKELVPGNYLANWNQFVAASPETVNVLGPGTFRGGFSKSSEAARLMEIGATAYMTNVDRWVPSLRQHRDRLARDLCIGDNDIAVEAFVSPQAQSGASLHYDFDINFNVQLAGRKSWRIAPNRQIENPMESFHVGDTESRVSPYATAAYPTTMPPDAEEHEVGPGDVVFLPRGAWHQTQALSPSLAIAFAIKPPTWHQLVARKLAARLSRSSRWRAYVLGVKSPARRGGELRTELQALLNDLRRTVGELDADEILQEAGDSLFGARMRWSGSGDPVLEESGPAGMLHLHSDAEEIEIEIEAEFLPLARWLVAQRRVTFTAEQALAAVPQSPPTVVLGALKELVEGGALERA